MCSFEQATVSFVGRVACSPHNCSAAVRFVKLNLFAAAVLFPQIFFIRYIKAVMRFLNLRGRVGNGTCETWSSFNIPERNLGILCL